MSEPIRYFRPRNWERWQNSRSTRAPWIKVYCSLLDDPDYLRLSPNARALLVDLWLLYAKVRKPLPVDYRYLSRALNVQHIAIKHALKELISFDWMELEDRNVQRVESREGEGDTEAIASDADASPHAQSVDLKAKLFNGCLDWLAEQSGKPAAKLRPMVGRWIKQHGEEATLDAFRAGYRESPVDPVAWLEATLNASAAPELDYDAIVRNV